MVNTALYCASIKVSIEIVKYLTSLDQCDCETKCFKNRTPLIGASINGHFQVVQHLVSVAGCNVNAQDKDGRDCTLFMPVSTGHVEIVKYLTSLDQCDCETKCFENRTPLIEASINGHFQVVQHLVSVAGCNVKCSREEWSHCTLLCQYRRSR